MQRFDDFLKVLLALVINQFIREADDVRDAVVGGLGGSSLDHLLAELVPIGLALFSIRNVHAAIMWDRARKEDNLTFGLESTAGGRAVYWLLTVTAFVGIPLGLEHILAHHLDLTDHSWEVPFAVLMIAPFVLYFVVDLALFTTVTGAAEESPCVRALLNWLVIDAIMLFFVVVLAVFFWFYIRNTGFLDWPITFYVVVTFLLMTAGTLVLDYTMNSHFFFAANGV